MKKFQHELQLKLCYQDYIKISTENGDLIERDQWKDRAVHKTEACIDNRHMKKTAVLILQSTELRNQIVFHTDYLTELKWLYMSRMAWVYTHTYPAEKNAKNCKHSEKHFIKIKGCMFVTQNFLFLRYMPWKI